MRQVGTHQTIQHRRATESIDECAEAATGRILGVDLGASIGQVPLQVGERPDGLVEAVEERSCAGTKGSHRLGAAAWLLDTEGDADSADLKRNVTRSTNTLSS